MPCPTLNQLPSPPSGKTGWPWTEEAAPLPERMPNGSEWPQITIVTPSYNQGNFLEETIRSILLQGYPNLEYIIIDGGSTDNSVEIIQNYASWLSFWKSEKDRGQSDALNKGFAVSTGSVMGWVNSDDLLAKGALNVLAANYKPGLNWWTGAGSQLFEDETLMDYNPKEVTQVSRKDLLHTRKVIFQVSTFWTREIWNKAGAGISMLNLAMDYELWLRFSQFSSAIPIHHHMGIFRTHKAAKTGEASGFQSYLFECDLVRLKEYQKQGQGLLMRTVLITFWTRFTLTQKYGWRSLFGRRNIPYV